MGEKYQEVVENYRTRKVGENRTRRLERTGPGGWGEQDYEVGKNRTRRLGGTGPEVGENRIRS